MDKTTKDMNKDGLLTKEGMSLLLPFVMITTCFALWGFANDVTTPMVKAFSKIFRMSVTEGAMVPVAFYLGYFVMAFPAALFIQRYSFKAGVMLGLLLFAAGSLIAAEAGCLLSQLDGRPLELFSKCSVLAGSPMAYRALLERFQSAMENE